MPMSKFRGVCNLRRSNSWSGDTRWTRQLARHTLSHVCYDPASQGYKYVLSTGSSAIIAYETENCMKESGVPGDIPRVSDIDMQQQLSCLELALCRTQDELARLSLPMPRAPPANDKKRSDALQEQLLAQKQLVECLKAQNNKLKSAQRRTLDLKLHGRKLRIPLGAGCCTNMMFLLVAGLFCVTVACISDRVFRSLIFPSGQASQSKVSVKCLTRPHAGSVLAAEGMVLPGWLSAGWLDSSDVSVAAPCPPRFPFVLHARNGANGRAILDWLSTNRSAAKSLKRLVIAQGALLVRGLTDFDDEHFEQTMKLLEMPPFAYTGSIGRRETVTKNSKRTFTTTYPSNMILMPHIEFGNKASRPEFIAFYAKSLPEYYGETPLVDFQSVWQQMSTQLKLKFAEGIRFTTCLYPDYFWWLWGDYASTWKGAFHTEDPNFAMEQCKAMNGVQSCSWRLDGSLEYVTEFPAVHFGEKRGSVLSATFGFWNALLPLFSMARFAERFSLWDRMYTYFFMRFKFGSTYFDPTPTRATFIDGSHLSNAESQELSNLIWDNAVISPARAADMTIIDNMHIAHGRMNVGGPIEKRQVVSYIGGQFQVPEKVEVHTKFSASDESAGDPVHI